MNILFVENHERFAASVTRLFLSDHNVSVVPSIKQANALLTEQSFDLLIVDYDLDDGKGEELVSHLRQKNQIVPIIAASSHERGNSAILKAGANAICPKLRFDEINQVIQQITGFPRTDQLRN